MPAAGHDIIVIGSSAGGLKALTAIVGRLPAGLAAALFIVQHVSPAYPSLLPQILSDNGPLPAVHPADGAPIEKGRIYVAPPDRHLLIHPGYVQVIRGPKENRFRPSVDALFRSAARAYGPRTVGVVLTGFLDDGTVGLQAIKQRGGVTVVQDPKEAEYPSMPGSAVRFAPVDHSLLLAEIPDFLVRMSQAPAERHGDRGMPDDVEVESEVAEQHMNTRQFMENVEAIGSRTILTCPTCSGALWQVGESEPLRFRCHIGHAFTADSLLAEQTYSLENALWSALRLMEEKAVFARRMAERRHTLNLPEAAQPYEEYAERLDREVELLRQLTIAGFATRHVAAPEGEPEQEE